MTRVDAPSQVEYVLFIWFLTLACSLRWELVGESELWTWFPYDLPALRAAGFEDTFLVATMPLEGLA